MGRELSPLRLEARDYRKFPNIPRWHSSCGFIRGDLSRPSRLVEALSLPAESAHVGFGRFLITAIERVAPSPGEDVVEDGVMHSLICVRLGGPPSVAPDDLVHKRGCAENLVHETTEVVRSAIVAVKEDASSFPQELLQQL